MTLTAGALARRGFADADRAAHLLAGAPSSVGDLVDALGAAADPDLALLALIRVGEVAPEVYDALADDPRLRARVVAVLGASAALGDHLVANHDDWHLLVADCTAPDFDTSSVEALRTSYRRAILTLAARDLTGELSVDEAARELSDLAGATIQAALDMTGDGGRLAVIGMGKCGGRELNYVSDVDVVFAVESDEELPAATQLASRMMRVCGQVAWPVDAALRPEGKLGSLVRTLDSHEAYYQRWARTWEFQALLKARPIAGDVKLGEKYVERLAPLVWTAAEREHFVDDVQEMRRRVTDTLPGALAERELKLGPGGLRDVEFAVQLLQLVHGRADSSLRSGGTLEALDALSRGGYVGREDAATLGAAYRFLRLAEHRLQLQRLRRTHLLPDDDAGLRRLGRAMGLRSDTFVEVHAKHAREVRRLHEKLFYRPLLSTVAKVPTEALSLSPAAARVRLTALGFSDPDGALRHIAALADGLSRRAAIQRTLLPALLGAFADAPDPDAGLLAYRKVSEALQDTPWYLRLLRDGGAVAERLAQLLGSGRYVADLLGAVPESLRLLGSDDELVPRSLESLRNGLRSTVARHESPESAVVAARAARRHELLRVACADLLDRIDIADVGDALSGVAIATIDAALRVAQRAVGEARIAVIAMGRLGGCELGYGSDADVMFVCADEDVETAIRVVERLRTLLSQPAPDPPLELDAALRPEGRNGPIVRSLSSYEAYYRRWSAPWETQALLRAAAVAGDTELGARFEEMIAPVRYRSGGLTAAEVTEIRRIKARVDGERLPRGADPATHTKLGRGGLADVEWTVQLLQLQHAGDVDVLRTPRTVEALRAAVAADLVGRDDAAALEAAWRIAMRARNAIMLVRGRAGDQLPRHGTDLSAVARAVGYPPGRDPGQFLDDYRRATRRARQVVERIFYG